MSTARALYQSTISQLYMTFNVGDKPQFVAPAFYFPAGGGIYGFDTGPAGTVFNNGQPAHDAIMKLARPIVIPVRQNFEMILEFFPVGTTDALNEINDNDACARVVLAMVDGLRTRDVQ